MWEYIVYDGEESAVVWQRIPRSTVDWGDKTYPTRIFMKIVTFLVKRDDREDHWYEPGTVSSNPKDDFLEDYWTSCKKADIPLLKLRYLDE